jgi:hypothetical protein
VVVSSQTPRESSRKNSARRDIAIVMLVACVAAVVCVEFDVSEAVQRWTRPFERYVDMQEQERKTLAHDLHDELGQFVNAIKLDAVTMRDASGLATVHASASALIVNVDRVYSVLRGLIRQLRPVGFDDLGTRARPRPRARPRRFMSLAAAGISTSAWKSRTWLLASIWPGAGLMLVTGLSGSPDQGFGAGDVIRLRVSAQQMQALQAFVWSMSLGRKPV